jgi:hypothetical protein
MIWMTEKEQWIATWSVRGISHTLEEFKTRIRITKDIAIIS